ncbi:MAG: 3-keto-disaccharide hydrolase [Thermoguttaceae bacterium]|jgi:hypothetical protein
MNRQEAACASVVCARAVRPARLPLACVLATITALLAAANVPAAEAPKADGAAFRSAAENKPGADQPASPAAADLPAAGAKGEKPKAEEKKEAAKPKDPHAWRSMFDGKTLKGWKVPKFGGDGEVKVVDGAISIGMGDGVTGIAYTGELPKINYEFRMEARRTMGIDFFATTTFPYNEDPCSLVVGGWAGAVVGLSCVDYYDASDNITTKYMSFKDKQWYRIHIRVSQQRIEAWIDQEKVVDLATKGHKISIRDEVDLCRPFGIATWCTEGQLRKLEIRSLKPEEIEEIPVRDRWD